MDAPFRSIPGFSAYGDDEPPGTAEQDPAMPSGPLPSAEPAPAPQQAPPFVGGQLASLPAAPTPALAPTLTSARRRAGAAVVFAGVGVGTGAILGGAWGAGSGLLFAGAAMNALRARSLWMSADPAARGEAIKTTAMLVLGLAGAGYLGYRAHQTREPRSRRTCIRMQPRFRSHKHTSHSRRRLLSGVITPRSGIRRSEY